MANIHLLYDGECMSNKFIKIVGIVFIICIFLFSNVGAAGAIFDETNVIESGEYLGFSFTELDSNKSKYVQADIQVVNGGAIDIFVIDSENYTKYQDGYDIEGVTTSVVEQVKGKVYRFSIPDGDYYIVVDNTKGVESVDVRTKLMMSGSMVEEPGFEAIFTIAILGILSVLIHRGKR